MFPSEVGVLRDGQTTVERDRGTDWEGYRYCGGEYTVLPFLLMDASKIDMVFPPPASLWHDVIGWLSKGSTAGTTVAGGVHGFLWYWATSGSLSRLAGQYPGSQGSPQARRRISLPALHGGCIW